MHTAWKNDSYIDGFKNREERYKQYDIIDVIIWNAITSGIYKDMAFSLDRLDSECKRCFVIRCYNSPGKIVFDSISEFEKWING